MKRKLGVLGLALYLTLGMLNGRWHTDARLLAQSNAVTCTVAADTRLEQKAPATNYATSATLYAAGNVNGVGNFAEGVLKFTCPQLPPGATVETATLKLSVSHPTTQSFEIFEMKRDWNAGAATWNAYAAGAPWGVAGARANTDRGTAVLGSVIGPVSGPASIRFTSAGVNLVRGWLAGTTPNYGVIVRPPLTDDDVGFQSRETTSGAYIAATGSDGQPYQLPLLADTRLEEKAPTTKYGASTTLYGAGNVNGLGQLAQAALKFDAFRIPAGTSLQNATLSIYVTGATNDTYELYELKKDWTESDATWTNATAAVAWEVPGAKGPSDRGTTLLGTFTGAGPGWKAISLTAEGRTLLTAWASGTTPNNGLVLRPALGHDDVGFHSAENTTPPELVLTYTGGSTGSTVDFKFLHYNIAHGCSRADRVTSHIPYVANYIVQSGASVVALNEVEINDANWCNEHQPVTLESALESATNRPWETYVARTTPGGNSANMLLWLADDPTLPRPGFPNAVTAGPTFYYATPSRYPRAIGPVTLRINGRDVVFFTTHLDNGSAAADSDTRYAEVGELLQYDDSYSNPLIVAGDFNGQPSSKEITRMVADYYDAWAEAVRSNTESPDGYNGVTSDWGTRIDYVFFRRPPAGVSLPLTLLGAEVANPRKPDGTAITDHRAVLATFRVQ